MRAAPSLNRSLLLPHGFSKPPRGSRKVATIRCMGRNQKNREERRRAKELKQGGDVSPSGEDDTDVKKEAGAPLSVTGKPIGWSVLPKEENESAKSETVEKKPSADGADSPDIEQGAAYDLLSPSSEEYEDLPKASRDQILTACASVSAVIFGMGFIIRGFAQQSPETMGNDQALIDALMRFNPGWSQSDFILALVVAGAVTGARKILMSVWRDFAIATNRSNKQVLSALGPADILAVSFLPGISEEFLFRGGLIPALYADWRGVLLSGIAFGLLHNTGGRNWAFAAWASAVGSLYGVVFLATQNLYVPMLAHSFSNLASAYLWLFSNRNQAKS
ncbi:hypothetical protein BSKO_00565 [Bryopsis sp. KO-2023]|nr:hypothetical protein BSKO_00565 [Bryopsis sp. KO-2023]